MAKPRLGPAAAAILKKHTAREALAETMGTGPAWKRGAGSNQAGHKVTTLRLTPDQWRWLRKKALGRALESGAKADASEIVRELVAEAMKRG